MYALGIDLGTTYTAAATWRDGRAQIVSLGGRGAAIPSVVLLRSDDTFLTGEAANRRGLTEPNRVAREFKRRVGDTTPLMLGGAPYSAEALTSQLLRAVVSEVVTREGGAPSSVCVSHPANWGPYKIDLLRQAVRMADLPSVTYVTEPEAAAVNYAQEQRLAVGAVVAVYDLGGGTFDAAVLRRTATGFTILGQPEGIERLGGIDFDAAVFNHVRTALGAKLDDLDDEDPAVLSAVARLREECVQAKEALSADTDTTIPVLLPSVTTEVRLTRAELESMVRPALAGSIEALRRAVRSAGVTPEQLHSVLLVGGSSRMPLVGQLVTADMGRPVAVDTHPKHAVALGAARLAGGGFAAPPPPGRGPAGAGAAAGMGFSAGVAGALGAGRAGGPDAAGGPAGAGLTGGAGPAGGAEVAGGHGAAAGAGGLAGGQVAHGRPAGGLASGRGAGWGSDEAGGQGAAAGAGGRAADPAGPGAGASVRGAGGGPAGSPAAGLGGASGHGAGPTANPNLGRGPAGPGGAANSRAGHPSGPGGQSGIRSGQGSGSAAGTTRPMAGPGRTSGRPARGPDRSAAPHRFEAESSREPIGPPPGTSKRRTLVLTAGVVALVLLAGVGIGLFVFGGDKNDQKTSSNPPTTSSVPSDEQCTDAIMSNPRWVCLTSAIVADGKITIDFRGDGSAMDVNGGYHLHIYSADPGNWYEEDRHPAVLEITDERFVKAIGDAPKVCARIAGADHQLVRDADGTFVTGNCVSITRTETTTVPTKDQPTRGNPPHTRKTTTTESTTTDSTTTDPTTTTDRSIVAPTDSPAR